MTQAWYPFYWADYISKTYHLTQGQHGAYTLLLCYIYNNAKPIPSEQCYSIAKAYTEQEKGNVDFVLSAFFEKKGDFYTNSRCLDIIKDADEAHKRRVSAGKKGGKQSSSNATAMLKQPEPEPQPYIKHPPTPKAVDKSGSGVLKNGFGKWDVMIHLNENALSRAKANAPGWDIHALAHTYNEGMAVRGKPNNPNAAFPAWVKNYTKGKAL